MKLNKSTRYALYAAMEMTLAPDNGHVTAAHVAERYGIPSAVTAKVFQQLVRSGIAVGIRGTRGGYQLARDPSQLTVLDVIEIFEPQHSPIDCLLAESSQRPCVDPGACRLKRVLDEVDELVRCTFASITLETLVYASPPELSQPSQS